VLVSFGAGAWVERGFPGTLPLPATRGSDFDQATVRQASRAIETNYYDAGVGGSQLSRGSVQGMVDSLNDPFSRYLTAEQYRSLQDAYAGRHDGVIGIARSAVLDLRGNGGGRVSAAVAMVSRFVASGVVYEERGRDGRINRVSVDGNDPAASLSVAVLVDGYALSSMAVSFRITQVVDSSIGVHGMIPKALFDEELRRGIHVA